MEHFAFYCCSALEQQKLILVNCGGVNSWILLHGILHHIPNHAIKLLEQSRAVVKVQLLYDERATIPIGIPWSFVSNESEVPAGGNDYYDRIHLGFYPRSQSREDIWLYENVFYGIRNGIVLESGGFNGLVYSNSFFFEYYLSWKTIHIGTILIIL